MSRRGRPKPKQPMYTPKQRMAYKPCGCDPKMIPMGADEKEEFKLTGGFNVSKSNICPTCNLARSENGTCGC